VLEVLDGDAPLLVEVDLDHGRDRLDPRKLVGMVLVGSDEDHRTLCFRDVRRESVLALKRLGDANAEKADELVDRGGCAGPYEHHLVVGRRSDRTADHVSSLLAQTTHHPAGRRDGGVGVGVVGPNLRQPCFDEVHEAPGRGEIGVEKDAPSEGRQQRGAAADLLLADEVG
jgi:hypothetical protein